MKLKIHETFQQTIQGEGQLSGTLSDFIRLYGCPVGCPWCDTLYSPKDLGKAPKHIKNLNEVLDELKSPHVVITGGEPFIHKELVVLCENLLFIGKTVQIETSGSSWLDIPSEVWVTLSPKQHISPNYPVINKFWDRANEIKLVISDGSEVQYYLDRGIKICQKNLYLQPEWYKQEVTILKTLELIKRHPTAKLSLQTHKLIGVQ